MKYTCPTQRPNARHPTPPIFHWEWDSRWVANAKKSTQKKRNVHGRRKKLASPSARDTNMLVFLVLGDAKLLSFASGDAKVPDPRYFAFWWNIGFRIFTTTSGRHSLTSTSSFIPRPIMINGRPKKTI